ncbi:MAG: hypothetical protein JW795_19755 [Chitinivibrionales bacterium]|nr:hypothetical protein [Chitinivibrionales bacterium]
MDKWLTTIALSGGARQASESIWRAFGRVIGEASVVRFDSYKYCAYWRNELKKPDDEIIVELINQSLITLCVQYGVTHILVNALSPVSAFGLAILKKLGLRRIHWFFEDFRRAPYWQSLHVNFDLFLGIQKSPIEETCRKSGVPFAYFPTAADIEMCDESCLTDETQKRYDLCFIGIPSPYRIMILETVVTAGFSCAIAGAEWQWYQGPLKSSIISDVWIDQNQAKQLYNQSRIVLNLSVESPAKEAHVHQLSPRLFDILATGALCITEELPLLAETLNDCYYRTFTQTEQIIALCEQVCRHGSVPFTPQQRETTMKNIRRNHTWDERVKTLVSTYR